MLPNVYGFHWTPGHLIFLGIFFTVVLVIFTTVAMAVLRAVRASRARKLDSIRWHGEFHDLPKRDRACRHQLTGEFKQRTCERAFECWQCSTHGQLTTAHPAASGDSHPFGLSFPGDRLYHRGHTWVRQETDGTLTIGLDDFAARLIGTPDELRLPDPGDTLEANGPAWTMRHGASETRVLAPIAGEVLAVGGPKKPYYLKLKPRAQHPDTKHLLRGAEVSAWLAKELERLQLSLTSASGAPALADGGVLVRNLPESCPTANWDAIRGELFLHP